MEDVEQEDAAPSRRWDFSLRTWPVRLVYSLVVGTCVSVAASSELGTAVALSFFAVTTAIIWAARR
jgi:hypothetical protein